jgi:hypothetical protein
MVDYLRRRKSLDGGWGDEGQVRLSLKNVKVGAGFSISQPCSKTFQVLRRMSWHSDDKRLIHCYIRIDIAFFVQFILYIYNIPTIFLPAKTALPTRIRA